MIRLSPANHLLSIRLSHQPGLTCSLQLDSIDEKPGFELTTLFAYIHYPTVESCLTFSSRELINEVNGLTNLSMPSTNN